MELHSPRFDPYSSLQTVVDDLEKRGYKERFEVGAANEIHDSKGNNYTSSDLVINEIHRLVNKKNESEKTAVYAIASKTGMKGMVIDHWGEDGNNTITEFLMNVERHDTLGN